MDLSFCYVLLMVENTVWLLVLLRIETVTYSYTLVLHVQKC